PERRCQPLDVASRNEQPGAAVVDRVPAARGVGRDHGSTRSGGFHQDPWNALAVVGRQADDMALRDKRGHVLLPPQPFDVAGIAPRLERGAGHGMWVSVLDLTREDETHPSSAPM